MDQKSKERPQHKVARVQTDNPTPISLKEFTLQNIGNMRYLDFILKQCASLIKVAILGICNVTASNTNRHYLFVRDANIGEARRSPTIKADDRIPSSKLFKSKSPLHQSTLSRNCTAKF